MFFTHYDINDLPKYWKDNVEMVKMETRNLTREALICINGHRDACSGRLVASTLKISEKETVDLLRQMVLKGLVYYTAVPEGQELTDDDVLNECLMISGGYTDPEYADIY